MKRMLTTAVALTFLALGLTGAPAAHATSPTVVTIQFDDGYADQYQAMAILGGHGLHATFYINSGFIGDADHLSWNQVRALEAGGNEIAGHTIFHTNVKKLKLVPATHAICDDRTAIVSCFFMRTLLIGCRRPGGRTPAGSRRSGRSRARCSDTTPCCRGTRRRCR